MFFENEVSLGTGSVKSVKLSKEEKLAVVEFVNCSSIEVVLRKQPIKIFGEIVEVERYAPYLKKEEHLHSVNITGLGGKLSDGIKNLEVEELEKGLIDSATASEKEIKQLKQMVKEMKQENDGLQKGMQKISSENSANEKEIKELEETVREMKQENDGLQKRLSEISNENSTKENRISTLLTQNSRLQDTLNKIIEEGDRVSLNETFKGIMYGSEGSVQICTFKVKFDNGRTAFVPEGYLDLE